PPAPSGTWHITFDGPGGDAATKPAPAGTTTAHAYDADSSPHDQPKCGCPTRRGALLRKSEATGAPGWGGGGRPPAAAWWTLGLIGASGANMGREWPPSRLGVAC